MNASSRFRLLHCPRTLFVVLLLATPAWSSDPPRRQSGFFTRIGNAVSRLTHRVERVGDSFDDDRRPVSKRRDLDDERMGASGTVVIPPMSAGLPRDPYQPIPQRYGMQPYPAYGAETVPQRSTIIVSSTVPSSYGSQPAMGGPTVPPTSQANGTLTLTQSTGATPAAQSNATTPVRTQVIMQSSYRPGAGLSKISTLDAPWQPRPGQPESRTQAPNTQAPNDGAIQPASTTLKTTAPTEAQPPPGSTSTTATTSMPASTGADANKAPPFAVPLGNHQVRCPLPPYTVLDVEGLMTGSLAKDPASGQLFKVP